MFQILIDQHLCLLPKLSARCVIVSTIVWERVGVVRPESNNCQNEYYNSTFQ